MLKSDNNIYDTVIIGAGIGGLVCGCYLAKAGMKVLIVEQHYKPGGCCTSFKRREFTFDAAPQCFGSFRKGGVAKKVFEDLGIDKTLTIIRPNPTDTIITPDYKLSFWNDLEKTTAEFQTAFPKEKDRIKDFFKLLIDSHPESFSKIRSLTFKQLLDAYFSNDKLKAVLSYPILSIGGLPASLMSAFLGAKLYSEFLFDGGYYPRGGMQTLSDALSERFKEFGGELRLSTLATKIRAEDNIVKGVVLDKNAFVSSKYVVSDCDARQTFFKLLGKEKLENGFYKTIKNMMPSLSCFTLFLGIRYADCFPEKRTAFSFFSHYDIERAYRAINKVDLDAYGGYMFCVGDDKSSMVAMVPAPYRSKAYWAKNKGRLSEKLIERIQKNSIPDLSEYITFKETATPHTVNRYTLNYRGASLGWAGLPSQLTVADLRKPPYIQGLYLTGHWTTLGIGISGVAYVGQDTAKIIARKEKIS